MKKETQIIYATNKKVPDLIRLFIETGVISPSLKKENVLAFEANTVKFIRAKKGNEEITIPLYQEHSHLKIDDFKYTVYSGQINEIGKKKKKSRSFRQVISDFSWYGLK